MVRVQRSLLLALLATLPLSAASACGSSKPGGTGNATTSTGTGTGGTGGVTTSSHSGTAGGISFDEGGPGGPYADFPSAPVVDPSAPANAADLFGGADAGLPDAGGSGGPCLFEPEPDTLFPNNWLRPRFNWSATGGQNLFEIRLHTSAEINDLLVYTATAPWQMPKDMWAALTQDAQDVPITVTIRGAVLSNGALQGPPVVGSVQTMTIAPAPAAGTIVYWTTSGNTALKAFAVGDESVVTALVPSQVQMPTVGGASVTCIGCHTATPDGNYASFSAQGPWGNALASVLADAGPPPPFLGAGAQATLDSLSPLGIHTYSKAHWSSGDHVMVAPYGDSVSQGGQGSQLIWVDLEAQTSGMGTSYGTIAHTGDTNDVGAPSWSHDGNTIVYVSNTCELTGRLDACAADLYSMPYNNRQGGAATPVPAAQPRDERILPDLLVRRRLPRLQRDPGRPEECTTRPPPRSSSSPPRAAPQPASPPTTPLHARQDEPGPDQ